MTRREKPDLSKEGLRVFKLVAEADSELHPIEYDRIRARTVIALIDAYTKRNERAEKAFALLKELTKAKTMIDYLRVSERAEDLLNQVTALTSPTHRDDDTCEGAG